MTARCRARLALELLLADRGWHPWWQVEQAAGVFVDPRLAGRRFIRAMDDMRRRRGLAPDGLARYQRDPGRAARIGRGIILRDLLRVIGVERRGPHGRPRYRLRTPTTAPPVGHEVEAAG